MNRDMIADAIAGTLGEWDTAAEPGLDDFALPLLGDLAFGDLVAALTDAVLATAAETLPRAA